MKAIKICTMLLVFFLIILCIANFVRLADIKKIALRCIVSFFSVQVVTALMSVGMFFYC